MVIRGEKREKLREREKNKSRERYLGRQNDLHNDKRERKIFSKRVMGGDTDSGREKDRYRKIERVKWK